MQILKCKNESVKLKIKTAHRFTQMIKINTDLFIES